MHTPGTQYPGRNSYPKLYRGTFRLFRSPPNVQKSLGTRVPGTGYPGTGTRGHTNCVGLYACDPNRIQRKITRYTGTHKLYRIICI
jgi:hypothetical protein